MTNSGILTETYTITLPAVAFDADGGTPAPSSPVTMNVGSTITQPPAMTKAWHTFGGWYTDSARTVQAIFPITVTGNVSLYAKWVLNTFTSVADAGNYLASLPVNTSDSPASLPINILLNTINTYGKYVNLDLLSCTMSGTSFNPVTSVTTGKDKIVSIVLPATATQIGQDASYSFISFTCLKHISGVNITSIYPFTFGSTYNGSNISLQSVDFPRVTAIYSSAFNGCTSLQTGNFPLVTTVGASAFYGCTSLQSINFPQINVIYGEAFSNCTNLQSASFPASTEIKGYNPFSGCTSLVSFNLSGSGALSVIDNGKALVQDGTILIAYPSASGTITINTITSIIGPFANCTSIVALLK